MVDLGPASKSAQTACEYIALTTASFESALRVDVEHLAVEERKGGVKEASEEEMLVYERRCV